MATAGWLCAPPALKEIWLERRRRNWLRGVVALARSAWWWWREKEFARWRSCRANLPHSISTRRGCICVREIERKRHVSYSHFFSLSLSLPCIDRLLLLRAVCSDTWSLSWNGPRADYELGEFRGLRAREWWGDFMGYGMLCGCLKRRVISRGLLIWSEKLVLEKQRDSRV